MTRNASQALDLQDVLGRDAVPVPVREARPALPHRSRYVDEAKPMVPKNVAERLRHGSGRFHNLKPPSSDELLPRANDFSATYLHDTGMAENVKILPDRQPRRPHYIVEWAEHRNVKQRDIVEALSVEKGLVSKWFHGSTPGVKHQEALAAFFGLEDPSSLFRAPHEDWMWRFLRGRSNDEVERIKALLEAGFPRMSA